MSRVAVICDIKYQLSTTWIYDRILPKVNFIRKFIQTQEYVNPVPSEYKRRKTSLELYESSLMILARIESLMRLNIPLYLGSRYLKSTPWLVLGERSEGLHFLTFSDLYKYYEENFTGKEGQTEIYYRKYPDLAIRLGEITKRFCSNLVNMAICFMCDIIWNCGPDCHVLYDVFSNDIREEFKYFPIGLWEQQRLILMGKFAKLTKKPYNLFFEKISLEPIVSITELPCSENISLGEKKLPMKFPRFHYFDEDDEYMNYHYPHM